METTLLPGDENLKRAEMLASVLSEHALTYLSFKEDDFELVLKREESAPLSAFPQVPHSPFSLPHLACGADGLAFSHAPSAPSASSSGEDAAPATSKVQGVDRAAGAVTQTANAAITDSRTNGSTENEVTISAPLVGMAYRSREPGAPPFVEVGSIVEKDNVLCLIEAMKMFNEVKAPCSGTVREVLLRDGELVEFGAPLFLLDTPVSAPGTASAVE